MEWWLLVCVAFVWPAQITAAIQTTEEVPSTHVPRIVSSNQTAVVRRGEEALFHCEVDELGAFTQVWRKNNDTYFVRNFRLVNDSRISLGDSNSLQIINVKAEDAGVYVCQISSSPSLELRHELKVVVAPTVTTVPPDGKVDVGVGQSLAIGCRATGVPEPTVVWTLPEGVRLENLPEGNQLKIPAAEEEHAGIYTCTASNGYDPPVSKTIRVVVHPVDDIKEESVSTQRQVDTTTYFPLEYAEREATPFPASAEEDVNGAEARRKGNFVVWVAALVAWVFL